MRILYFGTYERGYPRNAQVIAALRASGAEVLECNVDIWRGREHKFSAGPQLLVRLFRAEIQLRRTRAADFDALLVGYPGHADLGAARRVAAGRPVVFNPLVSLWETFVEDRQRFRRRSLASTVLRALDRRALRGADLVVADTRANARFLARLADLPSERVGVCFVGAEERLFRPDWAPQDRFVPLFVGKLIPLHGLPTIVEAARRLPELAFRVVGSGQLEDGLRRAPPNVERIAWVDYSELPAEYARCGCALGIFSASGKASRVIPNKVFQALACRAPDVTADTRAARELLVDGENALLVPPEDPEALAQALLRLANDRMLAERIGAAGRATFEQLASERVLGQRWRALIAGQIEASRARRSSASAER
jgi:glycosyltransferase involved in cell wall biosynthesis